MKHLAGMLVATIFLLAAFVQEGVRRTTVHAGWQWFMYLSFAYCFGWFIHFWWHSSNTSPAGKGKGRA